ncbi:DUF2478 domain-containing protein [Paracoccus luteus]|uniref:DUF2478 domain-containing protein n=1 Tax=Paracoccus luteus TaxID=2508543 RepID=UPI00106F7858|nr:DUF2478 domain-containing protein [Paracoccus luteus]
MLAYLIHDDAGDANAAIAALARSLAAQGMRLAGAVQHTLDRGPDCACDITLEILGMDGALVAISQSLGAGSTGCRLDSDALERAVGLAESVLAGGADLLIVNKFGKAEAGGRGFRALIARALADGVPVLTAVAPAQMAAFRGFADGLATPLAPAGAEAWCRAAARAPA